MLRDEPELIKAAITMKMIKGALVEADRGYRTDKALEEKNREVVTLELILQVLAQFEGVFEEPQGLPPHREKDHAINIHQGMSNPNLRPYWYTHYQKDEIERLVRDMLTTGIIRNSTSPYASPVILVKKKDGSWRFCVDYRALNKITVPDKFPIPVIEELLDEIGRVVNDFQSWT